ITGSLALFLLLFFRFSCARDSSSVFSSHCSTGKSGCGNFRPWMEFETSTRPRGSPFHTPAEIVSLTRLFRGVNRPSSHSALPGDHGKRVDETQSSHVTGCI